MSRRLGARKERPQAGRRRQPRQRQSQITFLRTGVIDLPERKSGQRFEYSMIEMTWESFDFLMNFYDAENDNSGWRSRN